MDITTIKAPCSNKEHEMLSKRKKDMKCSSWREFILTTSRDAERFYKITSKQCTTIPAYYNKKTSSKAKNYYEENC